MKSDIERLKKMCDRMEDCVVNLDTVFSIDLSADEAKSLRNIIAHLDQPFQWGDEVEVRRSCDGEWQNYRYKFIKASAYHEDNYIVELNNYPERVFAVRHPKQTVQVTLDKDIQDEAEDYQDGVEGTSLSEGVVLMSEYAYDRLIGICKAIAQEGGDNG